MAADDYLKGILLRESVDTRAESPVRAVQGQLMPALNHWAGEYLRSVSPSGSFAKGTANKSGTDIDLFISLHSHTPGTLNNIYDTLAQKMTAIGLAPRKQNVSISVRVGNVDVDLVPARRQDNVGEDHSLYKRRGDTWMKTNVATRVALVRNGGRTAETRILKLWRNQKGLDFLSFYLELTTIEALRGKGPGTLSANVWTVFSYLRDNILSARVVDPANTNNVISDDLAVDEKRAIKRAVEAALAAKDWGEIVR
ncbi:MAG: nucleotidyltransferase [Devosia sp. 67-54]|uniref:nucleotidyltransferase n=1 Tax=unclassified Devosia TaxID=196773 RepID=UPI000960EFB4|nr:MULTISPECIES: nucleotidyltransferase [unclassified Devosia]MBN9307216.1 nucleotidyltransferase [Devosia sp.]OJX19610.1 MAG: nucleotidyltransferase [Devosia sp. 67-54]